MLKHVLAVTVACASVEAFAPSTSFGVLPRTRSPAVCSVHMQTEDQAAMAAARVRLNRLSEPTSWSMSVQAKMEETLSEVQETLNLPDPEPVASGGTQYATLPRDEVAPLFITPQNSVVGDGSMVGDKGFDPLGFADSIEKLRIYREAELKHGRLAMLAALGWPVAEFLNGPISKAVGAKPLLVASPDKVINGVAVGSEVLSRAPSVLNGGLETVSPAYWASVFAVSALVELYATMIQKRAGFRATMAALGAEEMTGMDIDGDGQVGAPKMLAADNYMPGDLGFDPLGLYKGKSAEWKRDMQLKELNNGRLAMIAITGYAFNEAATKVSVVKSLGIPQL